MSIVTIIYEAKFKHCIHLGVRFPLKKDGTKSKKIQRYCKNSDISGRNYNLTLKDKACDNLEL